MKEIKYILKIVLLFYCLELMKSKISKLNRQKKLKHVRKLNDLERKLQKEENGNSVRIIQSYKINHGFSPQIHIEKVRELVQGGYKKQIRKLFLKDALDILVEPFLTTDQTQATFNPSSGILGLLGIPIGLLSGDKRPRNSHILKDKVLALQIASKKQFMKKMERKQDLDLVESLLSDLEQNFDNLETETKDKIYTLRASIEVFFKDSGKALLNN